MGIQGIIRPPPEIRAVADKTASFVAKNGRGFENRIMNSAKGKTPKFAFLHDSSPFHAYYEDRIVFYTNGGSASASASASDDKKKDVDDAKTVTDKKEEDANVSKKSDGDGKGDEKIEVKQEGENGDVNPEDKAAATKEVVTTRKAKSIVDPVARELLAQRSRIHQFMNSDTKDKDIDADPDTNIDRGTSNENSSAVKNSDVEQLIPPTNTYTTITPPHQIPNAQLEIIKLAAQFVVLNGKGGSFLRELTVREWENPMWGFLQPRHGHFAFFTQLVELYRRLLQEAVVIHGEEIKIEQEKKKQEQTEAEKEEENADESTGQAGMSLLELANLNKFVSIDSATEEKGDIRRQIELIRDTAGNTQQCLKHSALNAEFDRYYEEKRNKELESSEGGIAGTARVDWHDFVVVETIEFSVDEVVEMLPPPPPPAVKIEEEAVPDAAKETAGDVMDESSDEEGGAGEEIQVVDNYAPKVVSSQAKFASEARTHVIDPITKKSIPIADMTEHMRIQLLDPKWAEEKAKFLEKQKESNLVGGDAIARNMDAFAKARTDLYKGLDNNESSRAHLDASRIAHAQNQMPQPRPVIQQTAPPVIQNVMVNRAPPEMSFPNTKRAKIDHVYEKKETVITPPVPPPIPAPPTVVPASAPTPLGDENDTEIISTTLSEADFAKSLSNPNITLQIQIPNDPSYASWNFCGQNISITVNVMSKVKAVKQQIRSQLGDVPVNKIQLKNQSTGFLKDSLSLAYLNIGPDNNSLALVPKVRGGRK